MVIVYLKGGLGNQMFQYAAARSLSWRHGTTLKLDISFLEGDQAGHTSRTFELDHFCITAEKASRWEISTMSGTGKTGLNTAVTRIFQRVADYTGYREKWFQFDPDLLTFPANVYLEGYWQSERYFADIREIIRKEFKVITPLKDKNLEFSDEIQAVNAVSLHVRRGDYVMDEKTRAMHGVCDLAYYLRAEDRITQTLRDPYFFVFSDDPEWVSDNLKLRHPTRYISHNGGKAHEDLRLMSLCNHHVIANSSFSWWGAWLSTAPDKLVIAPDRWFNDPSINTSDLIPSDWQRL